MGFNRVAFMLYDLADELKKSPKTIAYMLAYGTEDSDSQYGRRIASAVAIEYNEPIVHPQALRVLPPTHADDIRWYRIGENNIIEYDVVKRHKNGDVTLRRRSRA